jgi:hypothetical protein
MTQLNVGRIYKVKLNGVWFFIKPSDLSKYPNEIRHSVIYWESIPVKRNSLLLYLGRECVRTEEIREDAHTHKFMLNNKFIYLPEMTRIYYELLEVEYEYT